MIALTVLATSLPDLFVTVAMVAIIPLSWSASIPAESAASPTTENDVASVSKLTLAT